MDRKYIAFISYRHAPLDSAAAKRLHSLIEQYTIPKSLRRDGRKKLGLVFRDREELPVSSDLAEEIRTALDNSEFLIVVCTTNTPLSPWVAREIDYFLQHHERRNLLTVLAEGEPAEAFPSALTQRTDPVSGQLQSIEPLAVDVRADSHPAVLRRLRRELNRLVAVMLGCPYDALVLREQKRQRRRVIAVASAITAIALCFSSMLILKNREIDGKNDELLQINRTLDEKNEELLQVNGELDSKNEALIQANEALDEQNRAVLLRESQLLTADAQAALEAGDRFAALSSAVSALPRSGVDRPYYAPAESVLMKAMNLFAPHEPCALVTDVEFSQLTPIMDFMVTSDGSKLLTMDEYGVICCYNSCDASVIWQSDMGIGGSMIVPGFFLSAEQYGRVLCCADASLVCFDLESGEALWNYSSEGNINLLRNQFFLSRDGETLCFIYRQYTYGAQAEYCLAAVSPDTGELLQSISVLNTDYEHMYLCDFENSNEQGNAAFSSAGDLFAGAYLERFENSADSYEDDTYTLSFFCSDLDSGASGIVYSVDLGHDIFDHSIANMGISEDGRYLYIIRTLSPESLTVYAECVDIQTKQLVWQRSIPADGVNYYSLRGKVHSIISDSRIILGWQDIMYALDPETGETVSQVSLIASLLYMYPIDEFFFGFVLDSGYHAVGWLNKSGLHDSQALDLSLNFGPCQRAGVWNGGLMRGVIIDGYIDEFRLDAGGYAAVIPADDNCSVILKRAGLYTVPVPTRTLGEGFESSFSTSNVTDLGDKTVIGILDKWSEEDGWYIDVCLVVDSETGNVLKEVELKGTSYDTGLWFLPDASSYIICSPDGDISLWDTNGKQLKLLSSEDDSLVEIDGRSYWQDDIFRSASTRLAGSNDILSALCDMDSLTLWVNGEETACIPLPEQLSTGPGANGYYTRELYLSPLGYLLMSHYEYNDGCLAENLHVYDIASDSWVSMTGDTALEENTVPAMSEKGTMLAAADIEGNVHIFDMLSGKQTRLLELHMPSGSISQMIPILDDSFLLIYTEDRQVLIYEISSGELKYRAQLYEHLFGSIAVFEDRDKFRLYIAEDSSFNENGICIDTRSWTELARFSGMMAYLPEKDELILYAYNQPLKSILIPSTVELADMAMDMLGST